MHETSPTAKQPTLLFINGPVSAGKTTIAQRYAAEHTLALVLSADEFVGSMGQWLDHESEARQLALRHIGLVATSHLQAGYDVVVPYLLAEPKDMAVLERAAQEANAKLFECALMVPEEESIARAIERGSWGEPGSPPLTPEDRPILQELFAAFADGVAARPDMVQIHPVPGDINGTYAQMLEQLQQQSAD